MIMSKDKAKREVKKPKQIEKIEQKEQSAFFARFPAISQTH